VFRGLSVAAALIAGMVAGVAAPAVAGSAAVQGSPAMHIFAIATGQ